MKFIRCPFILAVLQFWSTPALNNFVTKFCSQNLSPICFKSYPSCLMFTGCCDRKLFVCVVICFLSPSYLCSPCFLPGLLAWASCLFYFQIFCIVLLFSYFFGIGSLSVPVCCVWSKFDFMNFVVFMISK